MPVIVRQINKVYSATAFLAEVFDSPIDQLYIGIGRDAAQPWPNEAAPPVPTNTITDDIDFWGNLKGIGKVSNVNNTTHGKQRIVWTEGETYIPFSDDIDKSNVAQGSQWYVINQSGLVYTCISNNVSSPTGSTGEPNGTSADELTGDGYHWRYLYNAAVMGTGGILNTLNWMPVLDDIVPNETGSIPDLLGANFVLAAIQFHDSDGTGGKIPNDEYRQIALLKNPQTSGGGDCTLDWYAPNELEDQGGTPTEGVILSIDNRVKIQRAEGQSETVVAILQF